MKLPNSLVIGACNSTENKYVLKQERLDVPSLIRDENRPTRLHRQQRKEVTINTGFPRGKMKREGLEMELDGL